MSNVNAEHDSTAHSRHAPGGAPTLATVRYQIRDLDPAIAFYTGLLQFKLERRVGSAFAMVSRPPLQLVLSGPGSSGARPLPDGRRQEPGGWNRIILYVDDLASEIQRLTAAGVHFRNSVEVGPGGSQIQIEDPDGNPIELHQAADPSSATAPGR